MLADRDRFWPGFRARLPRPPGRRNGPLQKSLRVTRIRPDRVDIAVPAGRHTPTAEPTSIRPPLKSIQFSVIRYQYAVSLVALSALAVKTSARWRNYVLGFR